jgi:hypothetical protein
MSADCIALDHRVFRGFFSALHLLRLQQKERKVFFCLFFFFVEAFIDFHGFQYNADRDQYKQWKIALIHE